MPDEWPLVGRDGELEFARLALRTPQLSGLVLAGRAGVGTTRLAKEILARVAGSGVVVRWVWATASAAGIPLAALAHLLPDEQSSSDQAGLLRAISRALVASAEGKRLVLGVDNASYLDAASATLIHQLCLAGQAFVVVTAQVGVQVADPIFALWKEGVAERLDISELTRQQSDELITAVLGGHVDGGLLQEVWELTLGNVLFLRETLQGGQAGGALVRTDGIWRLAGPLVPSTRLLELIESRLGTLSEDETTLLELLAYGESLGGEVLLRMGAERVLGGAERKGLVISELNGKRLDVRLVHPLYADVVRRRTSPLRERRIYQILSSAIERVGARRATDTPRLLGWRLAAGRPTDPDLLRRGAAQTMRIDYRDALRLAGAAAAVDDGFETRYLLGQVLLGAGRAAEAEIVLGDLRNGARDDAQRARLAAARASSLCWALGDVEAAAAVLAAAADVVTPDARDELTVAHASLQLGRGTCSEVIELLEAVLDRPGLSERVLVQALTTLSIALGHAGRYDDALAAAERGAALADRTQDVTASGLAVALDGARCGAEALAGRLDAAFERAQRGHHRALAQHWPVATATYASWLGIVALLRGQVRTAQRWLREASVFVQAPPFPSMVPLHDELIIASGLTGDLRSAEALLPDPDGTQPAPVWTDRSRSWLAALRGETSTAVRLAAALADRARDGGYHHVELVALHDVVRLGSAATVVSRIEVTAGLVQGELAAVYLEHARAAAAADGPRLDAVADRLAAIGTLLLAAEAAAQASAAHEGAGRNASSQASANRANSWARACESAHTPALVRLKAPGELTRRELEIAQLAASGMTSKAIAERLVVSVRTVDNVLYSVYAKLGIGGRGELAGSVGAAVQPSVVG